MAKKIIEVDCAPDTIYKVQAPTTVTGQLPEFCKCAGTPVINVTSEENVDLSYDQSNGMYQATPLDKTEDAVFEYVVICKNPDPCPDCPDCKGEVTETTGRVEIAAICVSCLPDEVTNIYTDQNLPEEPVAPEVDCAKVDNPYTVREEYATGYIVWILTDCVWGEPSVRNFTTGGSLNPSK